MNLIFYYPLVAVLTQETSHQQQSHRCLSNCNSSAAEVITSLAVGMAKVQAVFLPGGAVGRIYCSATHTALTMRTGVEKSLYSKDLSKHKRSSTVLHIHWEREAEMAREVRQLRKEREKRGGGGNSWEGSYRMNGVCKKKKKRRRVHHYSNTNMKHICFPGSLSSLKETQVIHHYTL